MNGFQITQRIDGAHPKLPNYPLLPGDLLVQQADGTFMKEAPGIAVGGFALTATTLAQSTVEVEFTRRGLDYTVAGT